MPTYEVHVAMRVEAESPDEARLIVERSLAGRLEWNTMDAYLCSGYGPDPDREGA